MSVTVQVWYELLDVEGVAGPVTHLCVGINPIVTLEKQRLNMIGDLV